MVYIMLSVDIIVMLIYYFIAIRKKIKLKKTVWIYLFITGFLFQIIFLLRKRWEAELVALNSSFLYMLIVPQLDNSFFEELAKLLAVLLVVYIMKGYFDGKFTDIKFSTTVFMYTSLAYGIGEAMSLMFIMYYPQYGDIFGLSFPVGYFPSIPYIYERFFAIQMHGIMGGIIGIGYSLYKSSGLISRVIKFFIIAMIYHIFVDGYIGFMQYYPKISEAIMSIVPYETILPIMVIIGYTLLYILYKYAKKNNNFEGV